MTRGTQLLSTLLVFAIVLSDICTASPPLRRSDSQQFHDAVSSRHAKHRRYKSTGEQAEDEPLHGSSYELPDGMSPETFKKLMELKRIQRGRRNRPRLGFKPEASLEPELSDVPYGTDAPSYDSYDLPDGMSSEFFKRLMELKRSQRRRGVNRRTGYFSESLEEPEASPESDEEDGRPYGPDGLPNGMSPETFKKLMELKRYRRRNGMKPHHDYAPEISAEPEPSAESDEEETQRRPRRRRRGIFGPQGSGAGKGPGSDSSGASSDDEHGEKNQDEFERARRRIKRILGELESAPEGVDDEYLRGLTEAHGALSKGEFKKNSVEGKYSGEYQRAPSGRGPNNRGTKKSDAEGARRFRGSEGESYEDGKEEEEEEFDPMLEEYGMQGRKSAADDETDPSDESQEDSEEQASPEAEERTEYTTEQGNLQREKRRPHNHSEKRRPHKYSEGKYSQQGKEGYKQSQHEKNDQEERAMHSPVSEVDAVDGSKTTTSPPSATSTAKEEPQESTPGVYGLQEMQTEPPTTTGNVSTEDEEMTTSPTESPLESPSEESETIDDPACFSADSTVELVDGSKKRMDEVVVGDTVRVGPNKFSKVFMWTHKDQDVSRAFIRIETTAGIVLRGVTAGHYIYANGALVAAGTVRVGDSLELSGGESTSVASVSVVRGVGLYNPQTISGDIVVDGVRASTYTTAVEPSLAHAALSPLRAFYQLFGASLSVLDHGAPVVVEILPKGASNRF